MPRNKRINLPGIIFHVITRGIEKCTIFKNDNDRFNFLQRLEQKIKKTNHQCFTFALMPTHYHLLIRSSDASISSFLSMLNTSYAIYFNKKYNRVGYLFQNRPKTILCQEENYFLELIRYINLNPYKKHIVKNYAELSKYPWTGHHHIIKNKKHPWLSIHETLASFSEHRKDANNKYKNFIIEGINKKDNKDLSGGGLIRSYGGWENVSKLTKDKVHRNSDERILGDSDFVSKVLDAYEEKIAHKQISLSQGWTIDKVIDHVCIMFNIPKFALKNKGRNCNISKAKSVIAYWGCRVLGISGKIVQKQLNVSQPALSGLVRKGQKICFENKIKIGDVHNLIT